MKKSWKIALWTCSGLLITTSSIIPIASCSFNGQYKPGSPVESPSFTFKNQEINYYSGGIDWKDTYDWAAGLVKILVNQANVEASNNAKLSTWNKNINEKAFSNDIDNNLVKGKKLTLLYSINTFDVYKDELSDFNNNEAIWDIIVQIFNQIKDSINKIYDLIKNGIKEILIKVFEKIKEEATNAIKNIVDKIIEKLNEWLPKSIDESNQEDNDGNEGEEDEKEEKSLFFHISPIVEDQIYNSKNLTKEQKEAYKSFNLMNDHLNIETDYLFDRYLFFHEINTLFYKKTYNDKDKKLNFMNIKTGDFLEAFKDLILSFGANWSGLIKIIIWSIIGSIPISFEAMLLEDLYIRLKRWQDDKDPSWNIELYKSIYEEIRKRWEDQLLKMLNKWIKNSFGFFNFNFDLSEYIDVDFIIEFLDDFGFALEELEISSAELQKILDDIKNQFAEMFQFDLSLNLSYVYENLCTPIIINILNLLSNPKGNLILIFQLIIDQLSKVGKDNLQFIEQLTEFIQKIGNKLNEIIVKFQDILEDFKKWFDKIQQAIYKDIANDNTLGLKEKITAIFKEVISLLKDLKGNLNQIKELLGKIDELVNMALGGI